MRRMYLSSICKLRRTIHRAISAEFPELTDPSAVASKLSELAKHIEREQFLLIEIERRRLIRDGTSLTLYHAVYESDAEFEDTRETVGRFRESAARVIALAEACGHFDRFCDPLRGNYLALPWHASFSEFLNAFRAAHLAIGVYEGVRLARRDQAKKGGAGKRKAAAEKEKIATDMMRSVLSDQPNIRASDLAEMFVGVPKIKLRYRKLYDLALAQSKAR